MKYFIIITSFVTLPILIIAQRQNNQIEINPFVRLDNYPKFSYHYNGAFTTDYLKMKGISYGINLSYKHPLKTIFLLKPGWAIINTGLIN